MDNLAAGPNKHLAAVLPVLLQLIRFRLVLPDLQQQVYDPELGTVPKSPYQWHPRDDAERDRWRDVVACATKYAMAAGDAVCGDPSRAEEAARELARSMSFHLEAA